MNKYHFLFALVLVGTGAIGQKLNKEDKLLLARLQQHIHYLADDQLEGRRTGTKGEKMAAHYISDEFQKIGLSPRGSQQYEQPFDIYEGKQINEATALSIDGKQLAVNKEFFPLPFSPNISIEALPSMALQEPGMPWFFNLKDLLEENVHNPHFDITEAIIASTRQVARRGGTAVFIYNTSKMPDGLAFDGKDRSPQVPIPVVYLSSDAMKKCLYDESATVDMKLKVDIGDRKRTGENIAGYIDNGAASTIILGAHFDHLGYGEDGNSREVEKKGQIHNGADDNASGTAALIELARLLKESKYKNNNYLFLAFSGEELGLYGSKYFTEHPTIDLHTANFMINMDMVGRLSDSTHVLTVGGYGTSPSWGELYRLSGKKRLYNQNLVFRFDSSGTGPSDHTSFYLKDIPVLFYFTGLHPDYHKPTDDFDKINYQGELYVVRHILSLIEAEDKLKTRLVFTKTREAQTSTSARFSVTMGIMPDYTFAGTGVRVDGVSDNRPAQKAGIKTGDVILSLGEYKTNSLENYMQALGRFKKGEKTTVLYNRGGQTFSATVEF